MNTMGDPSVTGVSDEYDATRKYLEYISELQRDWDEAEARGDDSVQTSPRMRETLSQVVRADVRHGARVTMPPTEAGPYSLSELALRTLIRDAVDAVPGAMSLRTAVDYADTPEWGVRGLPERVLCRVSLSTASGALRALADDVRTSVVSECSRELALGGLTVDVHIEDLHD